MRTPSREGPQLAAGMARVLFPAYLSVNQLVTLIDTSRPPPKHSAQGFSSVIDALWQACPARDRSQFIHSLAHICLKKPFVQDYHRVSQRQSELARNLVSIAYSAITNLGAAEPLEPLIKLLSVVERAERRLNADAPRLDQPCGRIRVLTARCSGSTYRKCGKNSGQPVDDFWRVHFGGTPLWELGAADIAWLRDDLKSLEGLSDRRVALSALALLLKPNLKAEAVGLRKLIGKDAILRKDLNTYLRPPPIPAFTRLYLAREARHKLEAEKKRAKDQNSWRIFRDELLADPPQLSDPIKVRTGTGITKLLNLTTWLHYKTGNDYAAAVSEWRHLEAAFSPAVANAYYDGMKTVWRITEPEAPDRTSGGITTKYVTIFSLTGPSGWRSQKLRAGLLHYQMTRRVAPRCTDAFPNKATQNG